ncbi:MAG: c-type cytochrome [Pseudomonadales bacterium]
MKHALWLLLGCAVAHGASYESLGTQVTPAELAAADTDLAPQGAAPGGSGTVLEGQQIYAAQCAHCHGVAATGGIHQPLALSPQARAADSGRAAFALDPGRARVIGNYWPYASTLYDYIRRAMPQLAPGSLSNDEAYAVTAYLLYLNNLLPEDARVDGPRLQALDMPARPLFYQRSSSAR